ncbi:MAG: HdeA/HdeB family chaperone [Xenococcaceae cyanobacterium MO_188.B29]|nr:HdeA/HdeB family chaperone [Xenococcaceae cyanobacterium MO_188.B29]
MKKFSWLLLFGAIAISGFSPSAQAQSSPNTDESDMVDLQTLTCRDLLKSEGDNRANLVIFMHAFINGKNNNTTIDAPALAEATDAIVDTCIDNPDSALLGVFEQNR